MGREMVNALDVQGLSKSYEGFTLDDVSFSLPPGYIMGLIGPNGAGKTTIIKLILNLVRKNRGQVTVFGMEHDRREVEVRSRIGFVHEVPSFFEHLSLNRIKATVAPFYPRWDEDCFQRLLGDFGLPPRKAFRKLSRGMKMKFSLALAFSHHADLIILDEPTSGLDPVARHDLLERLLALIQDERKSVLFSTQITSDLECIADYITFVLDGRLVFSASKDEVMDKWRIVKGDNRLMDEGMGRHFRGWQSHEFGFEALTDNAAEAHRLLGDRVVIEKASLDDIMFFLSRGGSHA